MQGHLNFHKNNSAFERHKWPLRHKYVIEECNFLNIKDVLGHLNILQRQYPSADFLSEYPWLTIVKGRGGFCEKYWFQCPICSCSCENLYREPDSVPEDWGCKKCRNLIYASQRFGANHPLRKVLTPRKKRTQQKKMMRQNRIFAKQKKRQNRPEEVDPLLSKEKMIPFLREFKSFIDSGGSITIEVDSSRLAKAENPSKNDLADRSNEMANEAISDALKVVQEIAKNSPSKTNRRRAQKMLDQFPPTQEVPVIKISTGSSEYTEEEMQKIISGINAMHKKPKR